MVKLPVAAASMVIEVLWNDLSWRAWFRVDCMDSRVLVIEVRPLSAACKVWIPFFMPSIRLFRSLARLFKEEAVKKFEGLSRAELTLLPVDRRFWVEAIIVAVDCSD